MAVSFRNVSASPGEPVSEWPSEAVRAALERGGLEEWRLLAAEIDSDPWGSIARKVEQVLASSRPYGAADLFERKLAKSRARKQQAERAEVASELRGLIDRSGLSQGDFARSLGTSASRLSTYVNGSVVPAATLMVRARDLASRLPQR